MPDRIPQVSRRDVLRIVDRDYPPENRDTVLELLSEYDSGVPRNEPHRVHLAILKLAGGEMSRIRKFVDLARCDFRDAIAGAEYPGFMKVGFVGVDEMTAAEVRRLQDEDWRQYRAWLDAE